MSTIRTTRYTLHFITPGVTYSYSIHFISRAAARSFLRSQNPKLSIKKNSTSVLPNQATIEVYDSQSFRDMDNTDYSNRKNIIGKVQR